MDDENCKMFIDDSFIPDCISVVEWFEVNDDAIDVKN